MAKYNGWANYETWAVNLWLENEESSYRYWRARAKEVRGQGPKAAAREILATELKTVLEDDMPELEGPFADLLNSALDEVDWHEIAKNLLA